MTVLVLGALFGGGLTALVYGLRSPRPALADVLAALNAPPPPPSAPVSEAEGEEWATRLGRRFVPMVRALGFPTASLRADLAVCGQDVDRHLAGKATCAIAGLVTPWLAVALIRLGAGMDTGWWVPVSGSLALTVVLFFAPDLTVRRDAAQRRREMRHTLSLVLDLTVIALAGGAGVQQALTHAVHAPAGWAAGKLRHALHVAQLTRTSPWTHLGNLGRQLAVSDLTELAATLNLAGAEGAKVRGSLAAKARAMRRRRISEADGAAQAATEQMSLPVVVLFAAFLLLIGYPALAHVLTAT
ncbi:type II secretion system F family protein [Streptomyces sp. ISL-22]|uniref:type II secretion system F family protein n=1 Tax=unclassified Streptomyces TaxID=2593676 RepID=UPI001BE74607|nr:MULTISPECIES: type II secretion system F family protein [unclassified Streptomyces]MBT2418059.1 type II secretion system F family protein [Streptomyces sp. ISL-24]MBT2432266.1 type II secretion system F family protein [Streptomyces sp. ISL-22]